MANQKKEDLGKYLGSGGARKTAVTIVNRHKIIDDIVSGSAGQGRGSASGKRGQGQKRK